MQNKTLSKLGCLLFLIGMVNGTQVLAASCEDNFSSSGSFFTGSTFKTWAELPNSKFESAYKGAYMYTVKDGWKILQSNKEMGVISAAQAASYAKGKVIPLNIAVEKLGAGTKISLVYTTPAGAVSPEAAVKTHFCKTIEAAEAEQADTTAVAVNAPNASNTKPVANTKTMEGADDKAQANNIKTDEFIKGNKPCLGGICIGDDVASLSKITWAPMPSNFKNYHPSDVEVQNMMHGQKFVAGANSADILRGAMPYMAFSIFDSDAVPKLTELHGFCENMAGFLGSYKSDSGFDTYVVVNVLPDAYPSPRKLQVTSIRRNYPTIYTEDQVKELASQFKKRYASIPGEAYRATHTKPSEVEWSFQNRALIIGYSGGWMSSRIEQFKQYPGCGKALSID
ncbi:hypothetical protein [Solimicrobium silvestre]|uniref:Uncharacterized protein n=1 Tax=Solimicrobium silvestre TaxID=2099400 RepID=A0A2S9GW74_9BURK|nr:hypothetical protein [Solimicrobium silvestre]PRC91948.1 hypothetical protein S2091_3290 [Solimicrobium silvestre]